MAGTKSERVAAEAVAALRDGDVRACIHRLVDYADRGVNNARTAHIFRTAIDTELAAVLGGVSAPDPDAPRCVHCGGASTYFRESDGNVGCNDCPGIMPRGGEW